MGWVRLKSCSTPARTLNDVGCKSLKTFAVKWDASGLAHTHTHTHTHTVAART